MDEYINKSDVIRLINSWWETTAYASTEPSVIEDINKLPTIQADNVYCPYCGEDLSEEIPEELV